MSAQRTLVLPLLSQVLRNLQQMLDELLQGFPAEVRHAAGVVATELVSNAVKYGVSLPHAPNAQVTVITADKQIRLAVSNGVSSDDEVREVRAHLGALGGASGPASPYRRRLQQLLDDPRQVGRLGLYRIGCETQFTLACDYADQILTMTATRTLE
ncbi:MAG: hypothetical protein U1A78_18040 [Polyangia bacterium]